MSLLGKMHPSKPVLNEDAEMSDTHKENRKMIDHKEKDGGKSADLLKESIKYNKKHASEHLKAVEDRQEDLIKRKKDELKNK